MEMFALEHEIAQWENELRPLRGTERVPLLLLLSSKVCITRQGDESTGVRRNKELQRKNISVDLDPPSTF